MKTTLGVTYKDKISGFTGVCTGNVRYISGCNQALLTPKGEGDARWFDEQRLEQVRGKIIVLDNGANPGCDMPAPAR